MKIALAIAYCGIAVPAYAQSVKPARVSATASLGLVRLDTPPARGTAPAAAVRVSWRLLKHLSVEAEVSRSGRVEGPVTPTRDSRRRDDRRELTAGGLARIHAFSAGEFSLEPVVGIVRLRRDVERYVSGYSLLTREWGPWQRAITQPPGSGIWTLALGVDAALGGPQFALVPEFRWHMPFFSSKTPSGVSWGQLRGALGFRAGF